MRFAARLARSATLMSWGNLAAKSASLLIVTPLALARLPQTEAALFLFLVTTLGLQLILDMGFSATFTRLFAFAKSGVPIEHLGPNLQPDRAASNATGTANTRSLTALATTARRTYTLLGLGAVPVLGVFATPAVMQLADASAQPAHSLAAWAIMLATVPCGIAMQNYAAVAQGLGHVARWQQLQMWFAIASAALAVVSLLLEPSVLLTIGAMQGITVINALISRKFSRGLLRDSQAQAIPTPADTAADVRATWRIVWPSAWRSGIGILFSAGIVQGSGVIVTQFSSAAQAGEYLLALQLIRGVNMFAQTPFYSKIPQFATLYAQGEKARLLQLARQAMQRSYAVFIAAYILLGIAGAPLLKLIGASVAFPATALWTLLGLAYLAERFGAMHIQLYSLSHRIIWHIVNGVTGVLMLLLALILQPSFGTTGFALAMCLAYASFYSWFSAQKSYRLYKIRPWLFERHCAAPAFALSAGYTALRFLWT